MVYSSKTYQKTLMKKRPFVKKIFRWAIPLLLASLIVLCHHRLICFGLKVGLNIYCPGALKWDVDYGSLSLSPSKIGLNDLSIRKGFSCHIDSVALELRGGPLLAISRPEITCGNGRGISHFIRLKRMAKSRPSSLRYSIEDGALHLGDHHAFFSFKKSQSIDDLGTFFLSSSRQKVEGPILRADCATKGKALDVAIHVDRIDLCWLNDLIESLDLFERSHIHIDSGTIEGDLQFVFDTELEMVTGDVKLDDLIVTSSQGVTMDLAMLNWKGSYKAREDAMPWWQHVLGLFEMSKLRLTLDEPLTQVPYVLTDIEGTVTFQQDTAPALELKGLLTRQSVTQPFTLVTKGLMTKDFFHFFEGNLSLSQQEVLAFSGEGRGLSLLNTHVTLERAALCDLLLALDFLPYPHLDYFRGGNGVINGGIHLKLGAKNLCDVSLVGEDLHFPTLSADFDKMEMNGEVSLDDWMHKSQGLLTFKGGVDAITSSGTLYLDRGELRPSKIVANQGATHLFCDLSGPIDRLFYTARGDLSLSTLHPYIAHSLLRDLPQETYAIDAQGIVKTDKLRASFKVGYGEALCEGDITAIKGKGSDGWFRLTQFDHTLYAPLVKEFDPDLHLKGLIDIEGVLDESALQFQVTAEGLNVTTPSFETAITPLEPLAFSLSLESKELVGRGHFHADNVHVFDPDLHFDTFTGELNIVGPKVHVNEIQAHFDTLTFTGHLTFEEDVHLEIVANSVISKGDSGPKFLQQFDLPLDEIEFTVEGEGEVFHLVSDFITPEWTLNLNINSGRYPLSPFAHLEQIKGHLTYDSRKERIALEKVTGQVDLFQTVQFDLDSPNLIYTMGDHSQINFDVRFDSKTYELMRFRGASQIGEEITLNLDAEHSHFFSEPIALQSCQLTETGLSRLLCDLNINLSTLHRQIHPLLERLNLDHDIEGMMAIAFDLDRDHFNLTATSPHLKVGKLGEGALTFKLSKEGRCYNLEELTMGSHTLKASVLRDKGAYHVGAVNYHHPSAHIEAKGGEFDLARSLLSLPIQTLSLKKGDVDITSNGTLLANFAPSFFAPSIQGRFDLSATYGAIQAKSLKPAHVLISAESGVTLSDMSLDVMGESVEVKQVELSETNWEVRGILANLSRGSLHTLLERFSCEEMLPTLANERVQLRGTISGESGFIHLDGDFGELVFKAGNEQVELFETHLSYTSNRELHILGRGHWERRPFKYDALTHLGEDKRILVRLANPIGESGEIEGRLLAGGGWHIERVKGGLYGVSVNLLANPKVDHPGLVMLSGQVHIDGYRLRDILPEGSAESFAQFDIGRGYELSGDLILFKDRLSQSYFKGYLKGRNFELKNHQFKTLLSTLYITKSQIDLGDFCISDEALHLTIPNIHLKRRDGEWFLNIPRILLEEFRPSLMTQVGGHKGRIKPFTIRGLAIDNVEGNTVDLNSFTGDGELIFVNTFKRSNNFLDIPIEILGRIGLDAAILVPIEGAMLFHIANGKIQFDELKECYSEGRRSRFTLSKRRPSTIDLKGDIDINIRMKQFVLLRLTQPFLLTVRGTLDEPKFALK